MVNKLLLDGRGSITLRQVLWLSFGNSVLKLSLLALQMAVGVAVVGVLCQKVGYCNFGVAHSLAFLVAAWLLFVITACFNVPVVGSIAYFLITTQLMVHVSLSWTNWVIFPIGILALIIADVRQMNLFHAFSQRYIRPMWFRSLPVAAFLLMLSLLATRFVTNLFAPTILNLQILMFTALTFGIFMLYVLKFPKKKASHA